MANRTCSIDGCETPAKARGWCSTHYHRWRTTGNPGPAAKRTKRPRGLAPSEVLQWHGWSVDPETGCWEWAGSRGSQGYGRVIAHDHGWRQERAHRASYEVHRGPIPAGMVVRHRCDNPPCVNPEHLILGSQGDNMQDMVERERTVHARAECKRGHDLTAPDAYVSHTQPDRHGENYTVHRCRTCYEATRQRSRERRRERRRARSAVDPSPRRANA